MIYKDHIFLFQNLESNDASQKSVCFSMRQAPGSPDSDNESLLIWLLTLQYKQLAPGSFVIRFTQDCTS